jgi:nicotinamidase-related amidase
MTTFSDRPYTAVLVIDVQNGVAAGTYEREDVVATIDRLVAGARKARVPVVWVQDCADDRAHGSEPWRIVPELSPADGDPQVDKLYGDSFEGTKLEEVLAGLGVGRLLVAGMQTDACVRNTLHGAFVRGYDTTLVGDAHTTEDHTAYGAPSPDLVIAHTNLYWQFQEAPGRNAGTVSTADVDFGPARDS